MADVVIYSDANDVVAHLPGVGRQLEKTARVMAGVAKATLAAHHMRTPIRYHKNKTPTIGVAKGKLDWFVMLEAGSIQRATGIEFGHRYQSKSKNRSGPWGESGGVGALAAAMGFAVSGFGAF